MRILIKSVFTLSVFSFTACSLGTGDSPSETVRMSDQALATLQIFPQSPLADGTTRTASLTAPVTGRYTISTAGTGNADLYVRRGGPATTTNFTCRSAGPTAVESCGVDLALGEDVYLTVLGVASANVSVTMTMPDIVAPPADAGTPRVDAGTPPVDAGTTGNRTTRPVFPSTLIVAGTSRTGAFTASAAGLVTFDSTGTGNVALLVNVGAPVAGVMNPTCSSDGASATERCSVSLAAGQTAFFGVRGVAPTSNAALTVTAPAGSLVVDPVQDVNLGPVPADVQAYFIENNSGMMHLRWHTVRQWDRLTPAALASAQLQGWTRSPTQEGEAGNGLQFLAMHRVMFRMLRIHFPQYANTVFQGWATVPTDPRDPLNPLPFGSIAPFASNMSIAVTNLSSRPANFASNDAWGTYLETIFRPVPGNPRATSTDPTVGLHNYLHARWTDAGSPINMGDPAVNIGNRLFWKLHGWIDQQWSAYRAARGFSDSDPAYTKALADAQTEMGMDGMSGMGTMSAASPADVMPIREMFTSSSQ